MSPNQNMNLWDHDMGTWTTFFFFFKDALGVFYEHGDISSSVSKSTRSGHRLTVALFEASRSHPQQWPNST
jgi:hypothetical protein